MPGNVTILRKQTPKKADEWRPIFLSILRDTANVRAACKAAGVTRPVAYTHKWHSKEFAIQWDTALADAVDVLEAAARQRALTISDTLLIFLLKSHRPEVYRETLTLRIEQERILDDTRKLAIERGLDPEQAVAEVRGLLTSGR